MSVQQGVVRVIGKGNKERIVPMGEEAAYWVRQFMLYGRPVLLNGQSSDVVFPSQRAQQMTRQTFWHRVNIMPFSQILMLMHFPPRSSPCFCHPFSESRCGFTCSANVARAHRFIHNTDLYSRGKREIETIA